MRPASTLSSMAPFSWPSSLSRRAASLGSSAMCDRRCGVHRNRRHRRPGVAEPLLQVDGVSKRFGGLIAVDHASLAADPGRITALIGPNGAGKTTLFAIITGFERPSEGHIRYDGADITGEPPHRLARRGI